jgi:hypothetical protein
MEPQQLERLKNMVNSYVKRTGKWKGETIERGGGGGVKKCNAAILCQVSVCDSVDCGG